MRMFKRDIGTYVRANFINHWDSHAFSQNKTWSFLHKRKLPRNYVWGNGAWNSTSLCLVFTKRYINLDFMKI